MLIFRQLFDPQSSTYTYLLADDETRDAVIVDPVFEQMRRDAALIHELGLRLRWTIETHVHADHVTAGWLLQRRLEARIAVARAGGAEGADRLLDAGDAIAFGRHHLRVRATPGHTSGCLSYVLDDESAAFTGDCLLIRGSGRTDFQGGDAAAMFRSVQEQIFTLPDACLLYPAHDYRGLTVTSVAEERRFNPRLGGEIGLGDFTGYMANLRLAHPKKIDEAVPANLKCGRPAHDPSAGADPGLGAAHLHLRGIMGDSAARSRGASGAGANPRRARGRGVRGSPGPYPRRDPHPAGRARGRVAELDRDRPVVAVCRAGSRSAQAVAILTQAGFAAVANLAGGMLRWRAEGHTVAGGRA